MRGRLRYTLAGMLYFAYGSNMCAARLRERLAREGYGFSRRRRGIAHDYRLVFDKRSSFEPGVGYANIRPETGPYVEGTLNELCEASLDLLDRIELVPVQYRRATIRVRDFAAGCEVAAFTYLAQPGVIDATVRPTRAYLAHLMAAADLLSQDYVRSLAAVECCA